MTKYYDLAKDNKEIAIKKAGNIIKTGGLVLFPTETVYGIGADGLNEEAVKKYSLLKVELKTILLYYMYQTKI